VDMETVISAAAKHGKALEINAYPLRLDLSDVWARVAMQRRIPLAVSTDTHILSNLDFMGYGVSVARRGWLGPGMC